MINDALHDLRARFAKILVCILSTLALVVVSAAIAHGTAPIAVAIVAAVLVGMSALTWMKHDTGPATRYLTSIAMSGLVALLVFTFSRSAFQIDMHMAFFAGLAISAAWCCWMSIVLAGAVVAVHHLTLNFVYPFAVFPDGADFSRVVLHAVILIAAVVALAWLTNRLAVAFAASEAAAAAARTAQDESQQLADKERSVQLAQEQRRTTVD